MSRQFSTTLAWKHFFSKRAFNHLKARVLNSLPLVVQREIELKAYEYTVGLICNRQWFLMRRIGRSKWIRLVSHWSRQRRFQRAKPQSGAKRTSFFKNLDHRAAVSDLQTAGLYQGLRLPQSLLKEMLRFAHTTPCYGNGDTRQGFFYGYKAQAQQQCRERLQTGMYFNLDEECAVVKRLVADASLQAIAAEYLQTTPAYLGSQLWWSFASGGASANRLEISQAFHYDLDGYRFLKVFFYLTDVDNLSGPHLLVRGTHRTMKWQHRVMRKRYSDRAILDAYGSDPILKIAGPAGYGFIEDSFCFHKGMPPIERDRLILQIEYGVKDYGMQHQRIPDAALKLLPGQALLSHLSKIHRYAQSSKKQQTEAKSVGV